MLIVRRLPIGLAVFIVCALAADIAEAEDALAQATGVRPIGFRGPGYSWSRDLLEVLADREYLYDASTLPTYIGPLARAYYFWTARLTPAQRAERKQLFGSFRDGLRSVKPYRWSLSGGRTLLEIPVTTMPLAKANQALTDLQKGKLVGRAVLTP